MVSVLILAGYVFTLAPTVTFWDAGEFIAAAKILGIPHPPGTPLFILLSHVWGEALPVGEFAWRLNLLTAMFSAAAGGFWFLVVHESLVPATVDMAPQTARRLRLWGSAAAVVLAAFSFTTWQNSTETEVYAVAAFLISVMAWLCLLWRRNRSDPRSARLLLLVAYLAGISIGNHLLTLLAVPGLLLFIGLTLKRDPALDLTRKRREWSQLGVLAGVWAVLVGMGLGNTALTIAGASTFVAAAVFAMSRHSGRFAMIALVLSCTGITSYGYLYLRSAHDPMINEAEPDNLPALVNVIRRAQYPVRTPFDDPTRLHGPDNPGRSPKLIVAQTANYLQYFDWQWGHSLQKIVGGIPVRLPVTMAFLTLGIYGLFWHRRWDPAGFWLVCGIFLVTGLGLVIYMNFKPGNSIFYNWWPSPVDHEVRERDYFFLVSFTMWGLWAGMGLVRGVHRMIAGRARPPAAAWGLLLVAFVPLLLNAKTASRRHGPDATLAADFAYNLLNSVPPYGILFTHGDNDTFPLWWAQEVAGIRPDVTIVCLALAQTPWYMRQLREVPIRKFDAASAPPPWSGREVEPPGNALHDLTDAEIAGIRPVMLPGDLVASVGEARYVIPANTPIYPNDVLQIKVMQHNIGRRPIALALTTGRDFHGLAPYLVQKGLVYHLQTTPVDTTSPAIDTQRQAGTFLDVPATSTLAWETWRFGQLFTGDLGLVDRTSQAIAWNLSLPFTQLAWAWRERGDQERLGRNLARAAHLADDPALHAAAARFRQSTLERSLGVPE